MQQTSIRLSKDTVEELHKVKKAFGFSSLDQTIAEMILLVKVYCIKQVEKND